MASLDCGLSPLPFLGPAQLLWHRLCHRHKSLSVGPLHSMATINPYISHAEPASGLFVYSNGGWLCRFSTETSETKWKQREGSEWSRYYSYCYTLPRCGLAGTQVTLGQGLKVKGSRYLPTQGGDIDIFDLDHLPQTGLRKLPRLT